MDILDIKSPQDIKGLNKKELVKLNEDMRDFLINSISKTGGHLGSSLGTVEIITALHYVFDSPRDKIIFDVGHQAYAHKILTGRAQSFSTLRQFEGLSGFLKRDESIHDIWESGHASNSISAAIGFAMQRDLDKKDNHVICVIGDGSMTNGMSLEALNHLIEINKKVIVIINDNEMSISPNIGFIDNIFKSLEINKSYDNTKKVIRNSLDKIDSSKKTTKLLSSFKNKLKTEINQTKGFFNLLGFKYYGPVDGHNMDELIESLNVVKEFKTPVIMHVKTQKGKGYLPAEENSWHGVNKFDIKTGKVEGKSHVSNSYVISHTLCNLIENNKDIVVITPAMLEGSELNIIQEKYPNNITDVGIAEEHGASLSAGLALAGKKPFLSIYSTFLQRAYDQVFQDIVRQKCNVVIGVDRAGIVGADGETHQGIYDISFLSHMPYVTIMQGKDAKEMRSLLKLAFEIEGPVFLRYSRHGKNALCDLDSEILDIEYGKWDELTCGNEVVIVSYGEEISNIYKNYKDNDSVGVINARFIKPLDEKLLKDISSKKIIVVEESARLGGLGNLIIDFYNRKKMEVSVDIMAIDDHFVEHGDVEILKDKEGISLKSINKKVDEIING